MTDLTLTSLPSQTYEIFTPAIQFSTVDFVQTPDCEYTLTYWVQVKDIDTDTYAPLPDFIVEMFWLGFDVYTDDEANLGNYQISIIGNVPSDY